MIREALEKLHEWASAATVTIAADRGRPRHVAVRDGYKVVEVKGTAVEQPAHGVRSIADVAHVLNRYGREIDAVIGDDGCGVVYVDRVCGEPDAWSIQYRPEPSDQLARWVREMESSTLLEQLVQYGSDLDDQRMVTALRAQLSGLEIGVRGSSKISIGANGEILAKDDSASRSMSVTLPEFVTLASCRLVEDDGATAAPLRLRVLARVSSGALYVKFEPVGWHAWRRAQVRYIAAQLYLLLVQERAPKSVSVIHGKAETRTVYGPIRMSSPTPQFVPPSPAENDAEGAV